MKDWMEKVKRSYNFNVYRYQYTAKGLWMDTNRGPVILVPINDSYKRKESLVRDAYRVMERTGMTLPILPSAEGNWIVELDGASYYLMRWPAEESEWIDYTSLGESLAQFHLMSRYITHEHASSRELGTWEQDWSNKIRNLYQYQRVAYGRVGRPGAHPMDSYLVQNFEPLLQRCQSALSYLQQANYAEVCTNCQAVGKISHERFGHQQFIVSSHENILYVDPFLWMEDTRVRDIGQFIQADVLEFGWNPQQIYSFLYGYQRVAPLLPQEYYIMYAMFLMPTEALNKINRIYYRPSPLASLFSPLFPGFEPGSPDHHDKNEEVEQEEWERNETLINKFPELMEQAFQVKIKK
ncbi:hypothetical protein [Ammoniphilus sp. CFH 90114]|uniref:hypothetical protein n=1 Tax=Ammoniphilus sp. CFH 90114 TaxID=2493665 RepID=UPI0010284910|nr:hypothetical protein [Ammoniphilus sp. CFH 90114]RXT05739.1 hypothetical protein EIZ39_16660 [Ammoniphilus sp. CFH 90114]